MINWPIDAIGNVSQSLKVFHYLEHRLVPGLEVGHFAFVAFSRYGATNARLRGMKRLGLAF